MTHQLKETNVYQNNYVFVDRVIDGDTVSVIYDNGKKAKVRINGIDAPELSQEWGKQSKEKLESMVLNKRVILREEGTDKYRRTVGKLFIVNLKPGYPHVIDVQMIMLMSGSAWWYSKYDNNSRYEKSMGNAKKDAVGLWSQNNPAPMNPSDYRKMKKGSKTISNLIINANLSLNQCRKVIKSNIVNTFGMTHGAANRIVLSRIYKQNHVSSPFLLQDRIQSILCVCKNISDSK